MNNTYCALGYAIANFQAFEMHISMAVWNLIGAGQDVGMAVTTQLSFRRLYELLRALFEIRFSEFPEEKEYSDLKAELDSVLKKTAKIEEKRNTYIHSVWFNLHPAEEGHKPEKVVNRLKHRISKKGKVDIGSHPLEENEVGEFANEILAVIKQFSNFIRRAEELGLAPALPTVSAEMIREDIRRRDSDSSRATLPNNDLDV